MTRPNTEVYSTVFSYRDNRSIAQGNRTKRPFNMAVFLRLIMLLVSWASLTNALQGDVAALARSHMNG